MHFINKILVISLVVITMSCNKLELKSLGDPLGFSGIASLNLTSEGYRISWPLPQDDDGTITYAVYMTEVTQPIASLAPTVSTNLSNGSRSTQLLTLGEGEGPADDPSAVLLASYITSSSHLIPTDSLSLTKNYLIQVRATNSNGKTSTGGGKALYLYTEKVDYFGCLSVTLNATNTGATIKFDNPTKAKKIQILRDGLPIYETDTKGVVEYFDEKISTGKTYIYTCNAQYGSEWIEGKRITMTIPDPSTLLGSFQGCLSGTAMGADQISISFQFPEIAQSMTIYRNGIEAFSTSVRIGDTHTHLDSGRAEGESYVYTCVATVNGARVTGSRTVTVRTFSTNPPEFAGIKTAAATTTSAIRITWFTPTAGKVPAANYQIYMNKGSTLDWNATPVQTVDSTNLTYTFTNLGDEIPYSFGVRACSADDNCDANVVSKVVTIADRGAPTTVGAASATMVNGVVRITAPWEHSNGGVKKREVFKKVGAPSANFADYESTPVQTIEKFPFTENELLNPTISLDITGLEANTEYSFIVRDTDPSGNRNLSTTAAHLPTTGKLSKPNNPVLTSLENGVGADAETTLKAHFQGIATEADDPVNGGSLYLMYLKAGVGDACVSGTQVAAVSNVTSAGHALTYTFTGLTARTTYSVCIKAADSATNISEATTFLSKATLDVTAPVFSGVQEIKYTSPNIVVKWNPSSSPDIKDYKILLWKNSVTPVAAQPFLKSAATYPSEYIFSSFEYTFGSNDDVYVRVDACDDAAPQNCTSIVPASDKHVLLGRTEAPAGFGGISGVSSTTAGEAIVTWNTPAGGWTGYSGFKVYAVDASNALVVPALKTCPCATNNCPVPVTSCTVTNLTPYKNYTFHVRAYDTANNETEYLLPSVSKASARIKDSSAPVFSSALIATATTGGVKLDWTAASDDQSSEEGSISYFVYGQVGAFSDATNPPLGALLTPSGVSNLTYTHLGGSPGGQYFYTVCAKDSSLNTVCDGVQKSFTFPDNVSPVLTAALDTTPNVSFKNIVTTTAGVPSINHSVPIMPTREWDLTWGMDDGVTGTPKSNLKVYLYQSFTSSPGVATSSNSPVVNRDGATPAFGAETFTNVRGPADMDTYINYLLKVVDEGGNETTSTKTIYSANRVTISGIKPSSGVSAGGNWVVIDGTGIDDQATIYFGSSPCTNSSGGTTPVVIRSGYRVACKAPSNSEGAIIDVRIVNHYASGVDTSGTALLPGSYTYTNSGSTSYTTSPIDPRYCNNHSAGASGSAVYANNTALNNDVTGVGSTTNPYIICTPEHFDNIRYGTPGAYFKLGQHIDLSSLPNFAPIANSGGNFIGTVDGDGYMVINWSYDTNANVNNIALFGSLSGATIKNFGLVNANVNYTNGAGQNYGLLAGIVSGVSTISGVWASGSIVCNALQYCGGLIGHAGVNTVTITDSYSTAAVSCSASGCGGLIGGYGQASITNSFATGAITNSSAATGGLIGRVNASGGTLVNIYATGDVVSTSTATVSSVGALIGGSNQVSDLVLSLQNAAATGNVIANRAVGGIIGSLRGNSLTLTDVAYSGKISVGVNSTATATGGIVGSYEGAGLNFTRVSSNGSITGAGQANSATGGLIGFWANSYGLTGASSINNSNSTMALSAGITPMGGVGGLGGFVGQLAHSVSAPDDAYIVDLSINNSYFDGTVIGRGSAGGIGGLVGLFSIGTGQNTLTVNNSYSKGVLDGDKYVGGLIGRAAGSASNGSVMTLNINDSYSTATLSNGGTNTGGLIGFATNTSTGVANYAINRSYYAGVLNPGIKSGIVSASGVTVPCLNVYFADLVTSGTPTSSSGCSSGGLSKTLAEMKMQSTFSGFNFGSVWTILSGSFPTLL